MAFGRARQALIQFIDLLGELFDALGEEAQSGAGGLGGTYKFPRGATGVPNDSCDEYPFAKSMQAGNEGELCIDITPREVGGVGDVAKVTVGRGAPPNVPSIRAHVDEEDNSGGRVHLPCLTAPGSPSPCRGRAVPSSAAGSGSIRATPAVLGQGGVGAEQGRLRHGGQRADRRDVDDANSVPARYKGLP